MLENGIGLCSTSNIVNCPLHPAKINMKPENHVLVQMIFLFQGARMLKLNLRNLPGCNSPSFKEHALLLPNIFSERPSWELKSPLTVTPDEP